MLRILFNEPKRKDEGKLLQANIAIREYMSVLETKRTDAPAKRQSQQSRQSQTKNRRQALWSKGFIDALDELEQSHYCSLSYASKVHKAYIEEMNPEELDDYRRFVYFYKNAFIRLFSILDKLGYFLNDLYELNTEKVKSRFSYFTVLRRMHELHLHNTLEQQLYDLKTEYKEPLGRLRNHRNMEIHYINVEMLDDLALPPSVPGERIRVENIHGSLQDLQAGFDMVCLTLSITFTYISAKMRKG